MFAFIQMLRKLIDLLCIYMYILSIDALVRGGGGRELCVLPMAMLLQSSFRPHY